MTPAPVPPNEPQRLSELRRYGILDSLPEAAFDEIVTLAANICGTPMAAITFIDEKRQWLKAAVGLALGETNRETSFCGHTIAEPSALIVEDTQQDDRFRDNPFVEGAPNIRFYAGAPLVTPKGAALGALCVVDKVPRALGDNQQAMLELLARQVVAQLELRRLHSEMKATLAERDRAEQKLRLLHDLSVSIAEAPDATAAMALTTERLCRLLGWQVAGAWVPDEGSSTLRCADTFFVEDPGLDKFRVVSQSLSMPIGVGLPGQAWQSGQPVWINDLARAPGMPRARIAAELGIKTGAAVPVKVGQDVVAVIEFFSKEARETDPGFLLLVAGVVAELGGAFGRKAAEDALRVSEVRFRSVSESAHDAIVIADQKSRIVSWNRAAERTFGHSAAEAIGQPLSLIIPRAMWQAHEVGMRRVANTGQSKMAGRLVELTAVRKGGEEIPVEMTVATWQAATGRFFSGIIRDVSARKQIEAALRASEEALRHQATHDVLTNVPNRRAVLEAADRELGRAERESRHIALALVDLDRFKSINDGYGHGVGDEVLREAARRMSGSVRPYDCFGRYGGEEFIIVLPGCDEAAAFSVAERVRESVCATPIETAVGALTVTCSIGVATWHGEPVGELIGSADKALYSAKALGRNRVEVSSTDKPRESEGLTNKAYG